MARKQNEPVKERFAVMKSGRYKKEVKAWQYYSIFDYCRSFGCDRDEADRIARWCREKAVAGDTREAGELSIRIVEKEVAA